MKLNKSKPVLQIDTDGNIVKEWRSCKEIGKVTDMISSNIRHCLVHDGGYHLLYGYIWMYKSEYIENGLNINLAIFIFLSFMCYIISTAHIQLSLFQKMVLRSSHSNPRS